MPFKNTQTLKFKPRLMTMLYTAVNHNYGNKHWIPENWNWKPQPQSQPTNKTFHSVALSIVVSWEVETDSWVLNYRVCMLLKSAVIKASTCMCIIIIFYLFYHRSRWGIFFLLFLCILIIYIVSNTYKLSVFIVAG